MFWASSSRQVRHLTSTETPFHLIEEFDPQCYDASTMTTVDKDETQTLAMSDTVRNETVHDIACAIREQGSTLSKRRQEVGSGLISLGNLSFAALVFGQAFGGFGFEWRLALIGVVFVSVFYFIAATVLQGGQ